MVNVIEIKDLKKTYKGGHEALKGVTLSIRKGEIFALLGPNGAGKTTLIDMICGSVTITTGTVTVGGYDVVKDYKQQGKMIVEGVRRYITRGPVIAIILEGENAIKRVREITGYTDPKSADKGTIRGDFGKDSILEANSQKRSVQNLIHASGTPDEAKKEIKLWFPEMK